MEVDPKRRRILAQVLDKLDINYGKDIGDNPEKVRMWYSKIGHLNEEAALATADQCIEHYKWLPSISEFLEVSRSVRKKQEDTARSLPRDDSPHIKELQDKGLLVQRALIKGRANQSHDHRNGSDACPVCSQAVAECSEDECTACYLLDEHGIPAVHFA